MNWVDFWVIFIVVLLLSCIIFFRYILPHLSHKPQGKAKALIKAYKKEKKKEDHKGSSN
jgi:regulatory protein YycI of two-component signal transduction system YycFG